MAHSILHKVCEIMLWGNKDNTLCQAPEVCTYVYILVCTYFIQVCTVYIHAHTSMYCVQFCSIPVCTCLYYFSIFMFIFPAESSLCWILQPQCPCQMHIRSLQSGWRFCCRRSRRSIALWCRSGSSDSGIFDWRDAIFQSMHRMSHVSSAISLLGSAT